MRKKVTIGTCAICGKENVAVTEDHVPPKTIFLKPRPHNMIKVPACNQCNGGSSTFDQKFSVFLSLHAAEHHESAKVLLETNTVATLKENRKLLRNIIDGLRPVSLTTSSGILYGKGTAFEWDSKSYDLIIERTIRGFYYEHYKEILGNKVVVTVQMFETWPPMIDEFFPLCAHNEIGQQGELIYKYMRLPANALCSIWIFLFYHSLIAIGYTKPK